MGSRLRANPEKLFEVFAEVGRPQDEGQDAFVLQKYPPDYDDQEVLSNIPKFAFPCSSNTAQVDQFTFVFTDLESLYRFGYCRHGTGAQTCLCIISCLPWFEVFYKMMNFLAEIINRTENSSVIPFLKAVYKHGVPGVDEPVTIVAGQDMFNFTAPDPRVLPSIPASRNLTEYYNALDTNKMMLVFASMLHERRIMITSKKLSRVTACVHAAEALIYPMHWQHLFIPVLPECLLDYVSAPMPYLIGLHTSLYEIVKNKNMDIGDAVIVDADKNEVITEHNDLDALPVEVFSHLKKKLKPENVKNSMVESGDAISKAFLQSLVRLIGGYRDALKMRPNQPITFDRDAFVLSRTSASVQMFLENMLQLQLFQQFIIERLEILNGGEGFEDVFEKECTLYADRSNSQAVKYREWLSKQGRKLKAGGKDIFSDMKMMKEKAAPLVSTAVQSVKNQGKKAMSKIREMNEGKASSSKITGGVTYSREVADRNRPATITVPAHRTQRPPRPPPPSSMMSRPRTAVLPMAQERRTSRAVSGLSTGDDNMLRLSYHRVDVGLINDPDIEKLFRSASAETLARPEDSSSLAHSSSEEDVSSTPSSEAQSPSFEMASSIPYEDLQHSTGDGNTSPLAESGTDTKEAPQIRPRSGRRSLQVDHATSDRLISTVTAAVAPVAHPRILRKDVRCVESGSVIQPARETSHAPVPLPRRTSLDRVVHDSDPSKKDKPLIHFDSNESDVDPLEQFDPLREPQKSESNCTRSPELTRNSSARNSLVMRTPAFRRPTPELPLRTSYRDNESPERELSSSDSLADLFDPLAPVPSSSVDTNQRPPEPAATARSRIASDSLMHDWTLEQLVGSMSVSTVSSGDNVTCPNPPGRIASPVHVHVVDASPVLQKPPDILNVLPQPLPRVSATCAASPCPQKPLGVQPQQTNSAQRAVPMAAGGQHSLQSHMNSVLTAQRVSPVPAGSHPDAGHGFRTTSGGRAPGSELRAGTLPSVHQRRAIFENMGSAQQPATAPSFPQQPGTGQQERAPPGSRKKQWETFED